MTAHLAALRDELFADIKARTAADRPVGARLFVTHTDGGACWYYGRTTEGLDYPRHCRHPGDHRDEIPDVTDAPVPTSRSCSTSTPWPRATSSSRSAGREVSPDGRRLAYSIDTRGDERYDLYVGDLATGAVIAGPIPGVGAGGAWAGDDWLFYLRVDDAWRPHQVWRHHLGADPPDDLVLAEPGRAVLGGGRHVPRPRVGADRARQQDDHRVPPGARRPTPPAPRVRCVAPRREGVEYDRRGRGPDALCILHNDGAPSSC